MYMLAIPAGPILKRLKKSANRHILTSRWKPEIMPSSRLTLKFTSPTASCLIELYWYVMALASKTTSMTMCG